MQAAAAGAEAEQTLTDLAGLKASATLAPAVGVSQYVCLQL